MNASLPEQALSLLRNAGLAGASETPPTRPLPGGVSSDILRLDLVGGPVCVKRALGRLKVEQVWEAPVERNRYEQEWMQVANEAVPGSAPKVVARGDGLFAMEFVDGPVWKDELRRGRADPAFAAAVGRTLGRIHRYTAGNANFARRFPTDHIFLAIRLEPYLGATMLKHPDLESPLVETLAMTLHAKLGLVHGDVSPKNILVTPNGPVFLDAECAWYGDPAFDLAFCVNHLLLKCLWVPKAREGFLACFDELVEAYDPEGELQERAARLLPMLLLARVDGKSPVEYLDTAAKAHVRRVARPLILRPPRRLDETREAWRKSLT